MAGIQTSQITTATDGDLSLNPAGTGKVVLPDLSGSGEVPMGVDTAGNVKPLDEREFDELTAVDAGDNIMVQRGSEYFRIDATNLGGLGLADPSAPNDIVWSPQPPGSGTQADPYVLTPATVITPGGTATSVESCYIKNQKPDSLLLITEIGGQVGSRMDQSAKICDNAGATPYFFFEYVDAPNTTSGQDYDGLMRMGNGSIYVKWVVTQIANQTVLGPASSPTASPTSVNFAADDKYGTVSGTWADGAQTLTATDMVFSVNGGALDGTSKSVSDGDQIKIGFVDATVAAAANGDTISGTISGPTYYSEFSMVKDVNPTPFTIRSVSDAATSTEAYTGTERLLGFNAPTTITAAGSSGNALTGLKVSVNGGTAAAATNVALNPGDTVQGFGTTGGAVSTTYQGTFTVGTTAATWDVATADGNAAITKPTIDSPTNGSVDLVPDVTLVSSAYQGVDNPGPHTTSTWEVYEAGAGAAVSSSIVTSDSGDGTPLVLSSAASGSLKNEVVMVDSLTPTVVGEETQPSEYTLTTSTISNVNNTGFVFSGLIENWTHNLTAGDHYPSDQGPFSPTDGSYAYFYDENAVPINDRANAFAKIRIPPISPDDTLEIAWQGDGDTNYRSTQIDFLDIDGNPVYPTPALFNNPGGSTTTPSPRVSIPSTTGTAVELRMTIDTAVSAPPAEYVGGLAGLYINGEKFVGGETYSSNILTFASPNPDLKYFRPGDVVQTQATSTVLHTINDPDSSFGDGTVFTGYEAAAVDMGSLAIQIVPNNTSNVNTEYGKSYKQLVFDLLTEDGDFLFGSSTTGWATASSVDGVNWVQEGYASPGPMNSPDQSVRALMTRQPTARYLAIGNLDYYSDWSTAFSVQFNQALVDSWNNKTFEPGGLQFKDPDVKVVSTDLADNKMTVDGGDWLGSDGSGTAGGDTTVTYDITGKGTVAATDGSNVTLTNVDGRWIGSGSENAAGTTFYAATVAQDGAPGAPSDPVDTNKYTAITPSATTLTTATLNGTNLTEEKFYYSRVKYADDSSTGSLIESDFSEYHEFGTADFFAPKPGEEMGGGFFAGQINSGGIVYDLIVAPKRERGLEGEMTNITTWRNYKNGADNRYWDDTYGGNTTNWAADYGYSLDGQGSSAMNWAGWCKQAIGPNAGNMQINTHTANGTGIGGYNDWYIASKHEQEIIYRALKPSTTANNTSSGENPAAVPATTNYTADEPAQTSALLFREGGEQAFRTDTKYWTANQGTNVATDESAWYQDFGTGEQKRLAKTSKSGIARAIRRQAA